MMLHEAKENGLFLSYENYKGGINNLCVCRDCFGQTATSTKNMHTAIQNYLRRYKKDVKNENY